MERLALIGAPICRGFSLGNNPSKTIATDTSALRDGWLSFVPNQVLQRQSSIAL